MLHRLVEPAHKQQHQFVLDRLVGVWLTLGEFMGDGDYGDVIADRRVGVRIEISEGQDRYVCPACEKPMILASHRIQNRTKERFYFKHLFDDGSCSGVAGLGAKAITALRFGQTKESVEHQRFKSRLLESFELDPSFTNIMAERRWVDEDGVKWRQPDVQAHFNGQRIAFEAQLSTTFLHVIVERMVFYRRNGGGLLWLFRDLDVSHFRLAEEDIFYSNNRNAFRVTEKTVELSRAGKHFVLECVWHEPVLTRGGVSDKLAQGIVRFDQLTFDVSRGGVPRTYFYDYESARLQAEHRLTERAQAERDQELRQAFEDFYLPFLNDELKSDQVEAEWSELLSRFRSRGLGLPAWPDNPKGPFHYLLAAYSARTGVPIGTDHEDLVKLAHYLVDKRKHTLWIFRLMLEAHDQKEVMRRYDTTGRWLSKVKQYRDAFRRGDSQYMPNRGFDNLLCFLFPEISEKLVQEPGILLGPAST